MRISVQRRQQATGEMIWLLVYDLTCLLKNTLPVSLLTGVILTTPIQLTNDQSFGVEAGDLLTFAFFYVHLAAAQQASMF